MRRNQRQINARSMLKSTFSMLQSCRWQYGSIILHSFSCCCLSDLWNPQSHRSWCQSKAHTTSY